MEGYTDRIAFCERLLIALEVDCDMESVRVYVQSLTEAQVKEISIGLSNVRFRCFAEPCDIPGADYKVWLDNNGIGSTPWQTAP